MAKIPYKPGRFFRPRPAVKPGLSEIEKLYTGSCCAPDLAEAADWFSLEEAIAFVTNVYNGQVTPDKIDEQRRDKYAGILSEGVSKGWTVAIDYDSPDTAMLEALQSNIFQFATAKSRAEIIELSKLLLDSNGRVRAIAAFVTEAQKIASDFQGRFLKVEYDNAINTSYLAARWTEFADDDLLTFTTAGDDRVRQSHRELDGITLPKTHPFWRTFYPPLAWNCRCTVVVTLSKRKTAEKAIPWGAIDNVPEIFRSNFAIEGMAFPSSHPYYTAA